MTAIACRVSDDILQWNIKQIEQQTGHGQVRQHAKHCRGTRQDRRRSTTSRQDIGPYLSRSSQPGGNASSLGAMTARCGMPTVAARRDVSVCSRGQRCQTARKKLARCCKRQGAKGHGSSRARGIALDLSCSAQGLRNATKPRRELRSGSTASKLLVPARQSRQHGAANSSSSNTPGTSKPVSGQRRVATGRIVACLEQEAGELDRCARRGRSMP